jgi:hypothetical protein
MTRAVRQSVTVAGRAEQARAARAFTAGVPGPGHPCGEDAALLVNRELFANSVRHGGSGAAGETVTARHRERWLGVPADPRRTAETRPPGRRVHDPIAIARKHGLGYAVIIGAEVSPDAVSDGNPDSVRMAAALHGRVVKTAGSAGKRLPLARGQREAPATAS